MERRGGTTLFPYTTLFRSSGLNPALSLDGGRVLQNDGTFSWLGGPINLGFNTHGSNVGDSTIVNAADGTFIDAAAASINNGTGSNLFENAGTFSTNGLIGT